MQWAPAAFYRAEGADLVCTLCPHECRLGDGEVGACQVRRRTAARLETATFATTVRHIDPVERKPFYHFRPGSRVLTLAAPGCTFACHYCQNYRISQFGRVPEIAWSAEEVDPVEIVESAAGQGLSIALSYSEPTLAAELVLALAASGRGRGVPILWKSNGFITPGAIKRLAPCLEAVNVDLKAADESRRPAGADPGGHRRVRRDGHLGRGEYTGHPSRQRRRRRARSHGRCHRLDRRGHPMASATVHARVPDARPAAHIARPARGGRGHRPRCWPPVCLRRTRTRSRGTQYVLSEVRPRGRVPGCLGDAPDRAGRGSLSSMQRGYPGTMVREGFMAEYRFVPDLPDLIQPEDYPSDPDGRRVRIRIRITEDRVEILGDAMRPQVLERLLEMLEAQIIDQMLCG
jgi:hypothetical protein